MADATTVEGLIDELRTSHDLSAQFEPFHAAIRTELPPALSTAPLLSQLSSKVEKSTSLVLSIPVADVLVGAWSKLDEVHQFRGPQGGRGEVALASHTATGDYRPTLTVRVSAPASWSHSWIFDLRIELAVEALTLGIDGGKIRTITPCQAKLDVNLLWKEYKILRIAKAGPFDLLRHIQLGDGVVIP